MHCHSTLLLQVPSTNAVESWHASLKHGVKADMAKWSLCGTIQHLANVAVIWDRKADKKEAEFCTKHLADTVFWPGTRKLPYPVQLLVFREKAAGQRLLDDGVDLRPLEDDFSCDCLFFRQYNLPCQHVWQQEKLLGGVLTEDVWDRYAFMFEDCGFEIYEGMTTTYSNKKIYEEIGAPSKRRLEVSLPSRVDNLLTLLLLGTRNPRQPPRTIL